MRQHQIELIFRDANNGVFGQGFADSAFDKNGACFIIRDEYGYELKVSPRLMYAVFLTLAKSYDAGLLPMFDFSANPQAPEGQPYADFKDYLSTNSANEHQ